MNLPLFAYFVADRTEDNFTNKFQYTSNSRTSDALNQCPAEECMADNNCKCEVVDELCNQC